MKRQQQLLRAVLFESAEWLEIDPTRDWKTIQKRVEGEGNGFLSITMPAMHDALLTSIAAGHWIPNRLWKELTVTSRDAGTLYRGPVFLRGFLDLIFDFEVVGSPLKDIANEFGLKYPNDIRSTALMLVRQILLLNSKVKALPSQTRSDAAIEGFFETENDLRDKKYSILAMAHSDLFLKVSDAMFGSIFDRCQQQLEDLPAQHGPGQTAEKAYGVNKYSNLHETWTARLERVIRAADTAYYNTHDLLDLTLGKADYAVIIPKEETAMRITLVPKTAKAPRIIAMEPVAKQWVQQGLLILIDREIQRDEDLRGVASWRDQVRNQSLARTGSRDGSLATLDLSEASDRLHVGVVSAMLRNYPEFRGMIFASRSNQADYKGRKIVLHKFAPMGSAMCFAFETLAFLAIALCAICTERGITNPTRKTLRPLLAGVSVYGDDIIVPTEFVEPVINNLEAFGLKVNTRKSFWTGMFRESCGGDFFNGHDVSAVRLRVNPDDKFAPEDLISWIKTQNQLFEAGFRETALWMTRCYPEVPIHEEFLSSGFAFIGIQSGKVRYNQQLMRLEREALVPKYKEQKLKDKDRERLFHWFVTSAHGPKETSPWDIKERPVILACRPQIVRLRTKYVAE